MQARQNLERLYELEGKLAAKKAELRDLATMGAVITSIQEVNSILSVVMDMAVPMVGAEVGAILLQESGDLKPKVSWGISDELVRSLVLHEGIDLPTFCFNNREAVILNNINLRNNRGIVIHSCICLPIQTSKKVFGAVLMINKTDGGGFTEENEEELEMLLNFVAVAIDNSNLIREKLETQKMEQEMIIARQIQETILPQSIERIQGVDLGVLFFPAREVGGDFYDIVPISDSRFIVAVGDVSNKGVPAALIVSAIVGIMKTIIQMNPEISMSELATRLNVLLSREIIKDRDMFVTLFLGDFDLKAKKLSYCNAGHLPGLFWDNKQKEVCHLGTCGPIIGQFDEAKFKLGEHPIAVGDKLLIYTDGLTEAVDINNRMFGQERLEQVYSSELGLSPQAFCQKVREWVDRFTVGTSTEEQDDFTILQVKVNQL